MTPRPLHRWKTFWLGILILVFLAWSWMASIGTLGGLELSTPLMNGGVAHTNGCMLLFYNESFEDFGIQWGSDPTPEASFAWPPSAIEASRSKRSDDDPFSSAHGDLFIAHWLFILLFLIPWTAFLLWRTRRMKRLAAGTAEPPARSST